MLMKFGDPVQLDELEEFYISIAGHAAIPVTGHVSNIPMPWRYLRVLFVGVK